MVKEMNNKSTYRLYLTGYDKRITKDKIESFFRSKYININIVKYTFCYCFIEVETRLEYYKLLNYKHVLNGVTLAVKKYSPRKIKLYNIPLNYTLDDLYKIFFEFANKINIKLDLNMKNGSHTGKGIITTYDLYVYDKILNKKYNNTITIT